MALFYAKQEADRLGRTDPLTGLANRRAFYEATAQFSGCIIVLVIADIDRFKRINDRYGHAAGDEALKTIARIMQNELGSLGTLARVGGEEFAFACVNHSRVEVREHLRKLQQFLAAAPIVFAGGSVYATISAGIAAKADASFDDLYAAADRALYIAKASGRDRVVDADEIDAIDSEPIASKSNLPRAS
jgi:diguanylate cyclase (GGDEF)-like protein